MHSRGRQALRPGGHLALVWNQRDERIPWVRRLSALLGSAPGAGTALPALEESELFEEVEAGPSGSGSR